MRRPSRIFLDPRLLLYTLQRTLFGPFEGLRQLVRHALGRRRLAFAPGTWTAPLLTPEATRARQAGLHVVLVGPTIGEFRTMQVLGERLAARHEGIGLTYALRDPASVATLREAHPELSLCYRPVDYLPVVARWIGHVQPDALIFMEAMRFPTLAWGTYLCGTTNVLVSGRSTPREKPHYRLRAFYFRWLFRPFHLMLFQNERHRDYAAPYTPAGIAQVGGDLKFALDAPVAPPEIVVELAAWLDGPLVLAAGSTADLEEEALVVDAFLAAREAAPCRLLVAPRLLARVPEIVRYLEGRGLRVSRRTAPEPDPDVFLLDTLGELATAYRFAVGAYVGGALRHNGHNVLEPVRWGLPVAYGPRRGHFEAMQRLCEEGGVGFRVANAGELARHWTNLLILPARREELREKAGRLNEGRSEPLDRTADAALALLAKRFG